MSQQKKLNYRICVRAESNHPIEASNPNEAISLWQQEVFGKEIPYKVIEQEWIKGGFRLGVELLTHLSQTERDELGDKISIDNKMKSGEHTD
ncbi:MAG: hypothetical protein K0Q50_137 [Vampirovibrio sp.]|jgi:hypothetical protein|nr:hypothetical protein [Vampirovibrio sp.]